MKQEIIQGSLIADLNKTCKQCPFVYSKESCAFGNSAVKTGKLQEDADTKSRIIVYLWDKENISVNCPSPDQFKQTINQLRHGLNTQG